MAIHTAQNNFLRKKLQNAKQCAIRDHLKTALTETCCPTNSAGGDDEVEKMDVSLVQNLDEYVFFSLIR